MQGILSLTFGALLIAASPAAAQQDGAGVGGRAAITKVAIRPGALATIQGHALNSTNGLLRNSLVRVRDVRFGRMVHLALTDRVGAYSFTGLEPGNYIVEIVSTNQTPLAATNLINVNAGETVESVVKLPFKPTMVGNILGSRPSPATSDGASSSLSEIVPQLLQQLPQAAAQAIPAVVPVGTPISER
jgi:hypothetical protein